MGYKGEFIVVSGHLGLFGSLLVGSGCLFLVSSPGLIHVEPV